MPQVDNACSNSTFPEKLSTEAKTSEKGLLIQIKTTRATSTYERTRARTEEKEEKEIL